jgi:hypothetical protein
MRADLKQRGCRPPTIARKLAAIAFYHRSMDHRSRRPPNTSCWAPPGDWAAWPNPRRPRLRSTRSARLERLVPEIAAIPAISAGSGRSEHYADHEVALAGSDTPFL